MAQTATQLPPRDAAVEPEPAKPVEPRRRRSKFAAWTFVVVAVLVAIAASVGANTGSVDLDWAFGTTQISLAWVVLAAVGLGWLLGIATCAALRRTRRA